MTDIESDILAYLQRHFGRDKAVRSKVIASCLNMPERSVRLTIRELIRQGKPVACTTIKPAGYFIAVTQDEVMAYAGALKRRGIEDIIRRRDFLRASEAKVEPRQLEMIK